MWLTRLENGDIKLTVFTLYLDLEVRLHVLSCDTIFMNDGSCDPLPNLFFVSVLYLSAGDVIENLSFFEHISSDF